MGKEGQFQHLNGARSLVAFWIVCAHYMPKGTATGDFLNGAVFRVNVAVCFFVVVSGFVTHWTSEGRPLESVNELLHFYVRRLSRVLVTFWLAMLWAVYLQHKNGQELQVDYVVRCLCLVEQWVHWCPNGPSWFVFALLPSWILYPLTRKLVYLAEEIGGGAGLLFFQAFLFLSSAGPAVYLLLVHGNITMQEHSDMTFWPPSQMSDFVLGMTTAALVRRGGKYLHFLADFSLLVVVLVVFLLPRPATTWALHLNGWEPMLDHGLAPLLAAFILGSCADRERPGWCARLLAHPALVSLGEMSFEVYIFQRPVHDTFELFTATDEMDVFLVYLLVLWAFAGVYKSYVEDPVEQCLRARRSGGSPAEVLKVPTEDFDLLPESSENADIEGVRNRGN
ncbi:Hypothetical protein (Fragment) [Durusdinium trenchii]